MKTCGWKLKTPLWKTQLFCVCITALARFVFFVLFFVFFLLFRATLAACGGSEARG